MNLALLQTPVTENREENLSKAQKWVERAAREGARLVCLPEMFTCPYDNQWFPRLAEPAGGHTWQTMSRWAKELGIYLVGGSIPEREEDRLYNTSFVFDPEGREIARHRKAHLFDIDIQGGQYFKESDTFTPGRQVTVFVADGITFGLCICFDFRFPELAGAMTLSGAQGLIVPAAFNMTTGPAHWELLFRQRAVDNQVYTFGIAPARNIQGSYVSYGNSIACDPWGLVLARAEDTPELLHVQMEPERVESIRSQLPLLRARRPELYAMGRDGGECPRAVSLAALRQFTSSPLTNGLCGQSGG